VKGLESKSTIESRQATRSSRWRIKTAGTATLVIGVSLVLLAAAFPYRLAIAPRAGAPPQLDADLSDWPLQRPIVVDRNSHLLTGKKVYHSEADFSARFYLMWDKERLYFAGDVADDSVTAGEAWDTDRVNLVFDMNNDTDRFTYASANPGTSEWQVDDYWVFCRPFVDEAYSRGQVFRIARDAYGEVEGAVIAARRTARGYRFEMSLPIKSLPHLVPYTGKVVGFDLFVTDGDGEAEVTEIMWANRWKYDSGGIYWQWWKLDRLVLAGLPIHQ